MATLQVNGTGSPPLSLDVDSAMTGLDSGTSPQLDQAPEPPTPDATFDASPPSYTANPFFDTIADEKDPWRMYAEHVGDVDGLESAHVEDAGYTGSSKKQKEHTTTTAGRSEVFPRISKPVELLRNSYDVVVIGSGYGGGIAASRMARAGQTLCVLERGKERWPGEYPVKTMDAIEELHVSGTVAPGILKKQVEKGTPTGMYHMIFGKGQNAFVGNGLGGTSLINANVFMTADKATLNMKAWPPEIRENADGLDEYYKKVEEVLEPEEYPDDFPKLHKLEVLKEQAEALGYGDKFRKVRQTTRFRNGPNSCGVQMSASRLTGQDVTGINDGSKTTTLVTYLADAWNWGAEMFCECEVRYIEKLPEGEGYLVFFAWHGRNRGCFKDNMYGDLMWVHAKNAVFLGAGAIASTEILLRSKERGLSLSDEVGRNMSGNGDILAFGYNTDKLVNAIGRDGPKADDPVGPCITGVIDCRDRTNNPLDGFIIEEGAVPHALAHVFQFMLEHLPNSSESTDSSDKHNVLERTQSALARFGSKVLGPYYKGGAVQKTQVYLVMSHDSNQAILSLEDDKPVLEFSGVARSAHVKYLNRLLAKATEAVGGRLVHNPWYALMGQQMTVHPIGGACMARDNTGRTGVVNHIGVVFTGDGPETHDGLIVTDGSVIPTALGANPFATISALAERSVEAYAKSKGLIISNEKNKILDLFGEPQHLPPAYTEPTLPESEAAFEDQSLSLACEVVREAKENNADGLGFTEIMEGFVHYGTRLKDDTVDTYKLAHRIAESRCENARFFLSVHAFDVDEMFRDRHHRGMLTGTFVCPSIPGSPFMVQRGEFNLFAADTKAPGTRNLTYDFDMRGTDGKKLHFHGYKVVDASVALSPRNLWRATTTLYVTISEYLPGLCVNMGDDEGWRRGNVVAKGMLRITTKNFRRELKTMVPKGAGFFRKTLTAAKFATFFSRKSLSLLLAPLAPLQYPKSEDIGYINPTPPDQTVRIMALDGVETLMQVWEPTHVPGNNLANIHNLFMVPGAAVDHQIFAMPTIPFNAVNFLTRAGYRIFVSVHRICMLPVAEDLYTTYDTRLDLRGCLEHIRKVYGPAKVYTIAHCMGSVALSCGMLDGTVPTDWILGLTCSQTFMNPVWGPANIAKVLAGPIPMDKFYTMLAGTWFDCSTSPDDPLLQRVINQLLRLYPQTRKEMCHNAACHRCSLVFGRCWNHRNLNEATHRQMDRFFGGVNMRLLGLLMKIGYEGHVMSNLPDAKRLTTPENIQRLKGLPFLLWVGGDNAVLSSEATERTFETLCDTFGNDGLYRRRVVPGYGHLDGWMGRNAWKDVYPFVLEEVDRVCRGEEYRFVEPEDRFARMKREGTVLY